MGSSFGQGKRELSSEGLKRNESLIRRQTAEFGATGTNNDLAAMQNLTAGIPSQAVIEKNINYKDVALIREKVLEDEVEFFDGNKQDILRVVNDHGFMNTF